MFDYRLLFIGPGTAVDGKVYKNRLIPGTTDNGSRNLEGAFVMNVPPLSCETLMEVGSCERLKQLS